MKSQFAILLISSLLPFVAQSQITIQGTVRDTQQNESMNGVNVMIQEVGNPAIVGFSITDKDGQYRLRYQGEKDSLIISVSGFNIQKQSRIIARKNQTADFNVSFESIVLKEVKITPSKIRQTGDTINYLVDGFLDKNDRTIGDVLKKMPGIDVKESGQILYQNKPINKFYIEDLDLLQGRYGIATNNIQAKDVKSVQIMENHQPIKALKDRLLSEQAAINLKLKDSAKGTITATALLGAGASPFLWTGEISGMYFGKGKQNISTYKGNNTGNDVSVDLNSFYSYEANQIQENGLLNVQSPSSPAISRERYLFNRANAVTLNNLWKLEKDYQLNANIHYLNDRQEKSSLARTEYFLPGEESLRIEERLNSKLYANHANAEIQLNANKDQFHLNNLFKITGAWDNEQGDAVTDENIHQQLNKPYYGLNNTFEWMKNYDKTALSVSSFNGYSTLPHSLTVQPIPDVALLEQDATALCQEAILNRFASNTKVSLGFDHSRWKQSYEANFHADLQHLDSELYPDKTNLRRETPDFLRNDLQWNRLEGIFTPRYTYIYNDLRFSLNLPFNYTLLHINDRVMQEEKNNRRLYFNPSLVVQYKLSVFWDTYAYASYSNALGGIRGEYAGYIMQSYRNWIRNVGNLYESNTQNYSINLNYRNPLRSLFGNAGLNYFNRNANLLYGYDLDGILQVQTSMAKPNRSESVSAHFVVNQMIDAIASTIRLGGNYSLSASSQLAQGEIVKYQGKQYAVAPSITSKIQSWSSLSYRFTFAESRNIIRVGNSERKPIRTISQRVQLNFFPLQGLTINLEYEHFYNNAIVFGSRSLSFGDIGVRYNWKKMEFLLEYSNIFNAGQYVSASYNDVRSYYYAYDLRPAEVLLKIRFKVK
jgi:hypothetical protein